MVDGVLYLFSSNTGDLYLQDALNVLALPDGAIYHFRYNSPWVDGVLLPDSAQTPEENRERLKRYEGSTALIVLVKQPIDKTARQMDGNITFYPLRRAVVKRAEMDGTVLHVHFEVKEYVDWRYAQPDEYNQALRAALPDMKTRPAERYVSWSSCPFPAQIRPAEAGYVAEAWQSVVDALHEGNGGLPELNEATFYRVSALRSVDQPDKVEKLGEILMDESGYTLSSDRRYVLDLSFYHPDDLTARQQERTIQLSVDASYFAYTPDPIPNNFRYDKRSVALVPKALDRDAITRMTVNPQETPEKPASAPPSPGAPATAPSVTSARVWAPRVALLLQLQYPRTRRRIGLIILMLAQLLVSASGKGEALGAICTALTTSPFVMPWAAVGELSFVVVGPFLTAVAVYVIFQKAPASGG